MNSLVAALLLLLSVGFGCSQSDESEMFEFADDCIKIEFRFEVKVTYLQMEDNRTSVTIPAANFSSNMTNCDDEKTSGDISITWPEDLVLTLNFDSEVGKYWNISSVRFEYSTEGNERYFKNAKHDGDTLVGTTGITNIGWNNSYSCSNNNDNFNLMSEDPVMNQTAEVIVRSIKIQVFNIPTEDKFLKELSCPSSGKNNDDDDDKIVPIAVGCALAGLVIIVLIAYLIGRFRNRKTDTYQVLS